MRRLREKSATEVADQLRIGELYDEIERLKRRQRAIPFIDPIDVRYNRFTPTIVPRAKAVMFCLMDVSASMGEREKDLAKRFFILLHLFLKRKYERVDIVFIRHTHEAAEVDEQEFFYGRETGGTVVSSALKTMIAVRNERYPSPIGTSIAPRPPTATIRPAIHASASRCSAEAILPQTQYYAYIEIADEDGGQRYGGAREGLVARLRQAQGERLQFRHGARRRPRRHLSGVPQALRQAAETGGCAMTTSDLRGPTRPPAASCSTGPSGTSRRCAASTTRSSESRATSSASTSFPTRSRSSRPSRCSTPIARSACR